MQYFKYALWAMAAGALIPVMAVLNAKLGRTLGAPLHAVAVLLCVALLAAVLLSLLVTKSWPKSELLLAADPISLAGGLIVFFYVVSATLLAPRFGVGNLILFAVAAQIITSAVIDHFGWLGAPVRPVGWLRLLGIALLLAGLSIAQMAAQKTPPVS
jgi:bacterial/archaeal transporter family-2 protein